MDSRIIDSETYNFMFVNIKALNSGISDELITFYIDKAVQEIVIKTNRNKFPIDLKYLAIDLVTDLFTLYKADTNPSDIQGIQSMSEDGRTVNFGINSYDVNKLNSLLTQKLKDNETLINRYRLLYKVRCPLDNEQN